LPLIAVFFVDNSQLSNVTTEDVSISVKCHPEKFMIEAVEQITEFDYSSFDAARDAPCDSRHGFGPFYSLY
jgi:hypothetical protein